MSKELSKIRLRNEEREAVAEHLALAAYDKAKTQEMSLQRQAAIGDMVYARLWGETVEQAARNLELAQKLPSDAFPKSSSVQWIALEVVERDGNARTRRRSYRVALYDVLTNEDGTARLEPSYRIGPYRSMDRDKFRARFSPDEQKAIDAWVRIEERLNEARYDLTARLRHALKDITTAGKLKEVWPEAFEIWKAKFAEERLNVPAPTTLPTTTVDQVRKLVSEFPDGIAAE